MKEPTRVLAEGTLRYRGNRSGGGVYENEWLTARVFVLEWHPEIMMDEDGPIPGVTVVAREPIYVAGRKVPSPVGSIHRFEAIDWSDRSDLLTLDVDALVPA